MADVALTDEMKEAFQNSLASGNPVMVATASGDGMPDIAFKGSAMVWDADHVAFWERAHGMTERSLAENPKVCLLYRNPGSRQAWKMWGEAKLLTEGDLREKIMAVTNEIELSRDPERKGTAVLIRIDRVSAMGQVIMERAQ